MQFKKSTTAICLMLISQLGLCLAQSRMEFHIKVNGLTCPFCAYGLEKKLKKVKGVESVSIDLKMDEAVVIAKADEVIDEDSLRKAVRDAGFSIASFEKVESGLGSPPGTGE